MTDDVRYDKAVFKRGTYGQLLTPVEDPQAVDYFDTEMTWDIDYPYFDQVKSDHLAGYDDITPLEQGILGALPGVAESPAVGELEKIVDYPVIKQLVDGLTWIAQQAENVLGTTFQLIADKDFRDELGGLDDIFKDPTSKKKFKAAWNASAMFYESVAPTDFGGIAPFLYMLSPKAWGMEDWSLKGAGIQLNMFFKYSKEMGSYGNTLLNWEREGRITGEQVRDALLYGFGAGEGRAIEGKSFWDQAIAKMIDESVVGAERLVESKSIWEQAVAATRSREGVLKDWVLTKEEKQALETSDAYWLEHDISKQMERTFEHWELVFGGVDVPTGGVGQLTAAREALLAGEDIEIVKQDYVESLGALAVRAQGFDLLGQVVLDPANFILPRLGIGEKLSGLRHMVRFNSAAPEVVTAMTDIVRMTDNLFDAGGDAAKVADDIAEIAMKTGLEELAEMGAKLADDLRGGKDVTKSYGDLVDILKQYDEIKQLNAAERMLFNVSGGDPLNPKGWLDDILKVTPKQAYKTKGIKGYLGNVAIKLVTLTPESRAIEWMLTARTGVAGMISEISDPALMIQRLERAAAGAFGNKLGHMMLTPAGRVIQSTLKAWWQTGTDLLEVWRVTTPLRESGEEISKLLDTDIVQLVNQLQKGPDDVAAVFRQLRNLIEEGARAPILDDIARGLFKENHLLEIGEKFRSVGKQIIPYTDDLFKAALHAGIAESGALVGAAAFGVDQTPLLTKSMQALKSVEAILLLGMNPYYPINNFFNNEVTMLMRGLYNTMNADDMATVWKSFGIKSARMDDAFDIGGHLLTETGKKIDDPLRALLERSPESYGRAVIRDINRGEVNGVYANMVDWVENTARKSPKMFRAVSAKMEQMASQRATTQGMLKAWRQIWPKSATKMDPELAMQIRQIYTDAPEAIMDALFSARTPEDIDAIRSIDNIKLNLENILTRTADQMGISKDSLRLVVDDELTESIKWLIDSLHENPSPEVVRQTIGRIRTSVQTHLDDYFLRTIPSIVQEFANKAEFEKTQGAAAIYSMIGDSVMARQVQHARRLDEIGAGIRGISDYALKDAAWKALLADSDIAWGRTWDYMESGYKGIQQGLTKAGIDIPIEYNTAFRKIRSVADDFIKNRNSLYDEFFTAVREGETPKKPWDEIQEMLDLRYERMANTQRNSYKVMDEIFAASMANPETGKLVSIWREMLRGMRSADMDDLAKFRRSIRGYSVEDTTKAWDQYNIDRLGRQEKIWWVEGLGENLLNNDKRAIDFFEGQLRLKSARSSKFGEIDFRPLPDDLSTTSLLSHASEKFDSSGKIGEHIAKYLDAKDPKILASFIEDEPLAGKIVDWIVNDKERKLDLIDYIKANPEEAAEVQRYTDHILSGKYGDEMTVYSGKMTMYRTLGAGEDVVVRPWDSMTQDFSAAKLLQQEPGRGPLLEYEIPTKNIFTSHETHPGFKALPGEQEVILNQFGVQDARLISVDGKPPTPEQLEKYGAAVGEALPTLDDIPKFGAPEGFKMFVGYDSVVGRQIYNATGLDELWFERGSSILNTMEGEMLKVLNEPKLNYADLPAETQKGLGKFLDKATGELRDARHYAVRMAEGYRDSALLNYQRQAGFDSLLAHGAPFSFWFTHSIYRTLWHSLDRPAGIATWAKWKEYIDNAIGENEKFPQRLRGKIKIPLPFVPPEFGEMWIDPARSMGLPFEQFIDPVRELWQKKGQMEQRIAYQLEEWLDIGEITEQEYEDALAGKAKGIYDRARAYVEENDANSKFDILDFMNLSVSPHLPISIGWNLARGTPERLAPLPHTRTLNAIAGLAGIDPGVYDSVWGNVRESIGLPAFDQWEDYRVDREVSNMIAEGIITPTEGAYAQNTHEGEWWDAARKRVTKVRGFQSLVRLVALPNQPYPEGERKLREMYDDFYASMEAQDKGDGTAVGRFFDENPEFESRLALWKEPDERMRQFLIDQIWDKYNSLLSIDRKLAREQLGEGFVNNFLDQDTAAPMNLSPDVLNVWLQMLGGDPVGTLGEPGTAIPISYAPVELAGVIEAFYKTRNFEYPDWFTMQQKYFMLAPGKARTNYRNKYPQLKAYWGWRRDFLRRNPNTIPYLDEDFEPNYESVGQMEAAIRDQPNLRPFEINARLIFEGGTSLVNRLEDYMRGDVLSTTAKEIITEIAVSMGMTFEQLVQMYASQLEVVP